MKTITGLLPRSMNNFALCIAIFFFFVPGASVYGQSFETMFSLYENNRNQGVGNYITEDFVLLGHSLMLSETLAEVEEQILALQFGRFVDGMLEILEHKPAGESITVHNIRYFRLLSVLLGNSRVEDVQDKVVAGELEMIFQAASIAQSELMGHQIDYSRFKPRGRYTRSEKMERWFRAMTWAGSAYFPVLASRATGISEEMADNLTGRALEISGIIAGNENLAAQYRKIDTLLGKVFGNVEDQIWSDYLPEGRWEDTMEHAVIRKILHQRVVAAGKIGRISDGIVMVDKLEEGLSPGDVLCGMRLFPRRYSPDSAAFQRLVFPDVGRYTGSAEKPLPFTATAAGTRIVKGFPRALELMGLLGAKSAAVNISDAGDDRYEGYQQSLSLARRELGNPSNLAVNNAMMRYWLTSGTVANEERRINSMLGYWTWGRYISLLFTKQSVTGTVKSIHIPPKRSSAWLEPAVELYLWLKSDMQELKTALGAESSQISARLESYLDILTELIAIADLERAGYALNGAQIKRLNTLDIALYQLIGIKDHPIVVDVHTEPNSQQVVQEGIGFANPVEYEHGTEKLRGALFTPYEFKQNMSDRLTDRSWLQKLLKP